MSETVAVKEANAVDKLFALVSHDHPFRPIAAFVLMLF
jgi:hypothetical protein